MPSIYIIQILSMWLNLNHTLVINYAGRPRKNMFIKNNENILLTLTIITTDDFYNNKMSN